MLNAFKYEDKKVFQSKREEEIQRFSAEILKSTADQDERSQQKLHEWSGNHCLEKQALRSLGKLLQGLACRIRPSQATLDNT